LSGPLGVESGPGRRPPARHFQVEHVSVRPLSAGVSFVRTIDESDPITEVPPCSDEQWATAGSSFDNDVADTIPAPQWLGDED
jgi:hypothetical protein